ncbi:phosphatidate cytidylyltransferase [Fimbriiglobus ruber]|uniref:Phosphatidate cytidylyltransferase n=1 Tax=Fimbriiglobus ruber TaxID=1908690 RepID=A0A225DTK7_9BACT|nr:phosphatidate cytidylyltransferase [Fimbriiglobus ruber]OWK44383.1 Phosphatidate cytidylyltransferase [Fimbriiglobus ruber]
MSPEARERLFGAGHAFDHPVVLVATLAVAALLLLTPVVVWLLVRFGRIDAKLRTELMLRYWSWTVLTPLIAAPILLGAAWTILGIGVLSLLCYREYARATGLFREKAISLVVVLGILAVSFAELDHWYRLFVALVPFTVGAIAIVALLRDQPQGYIQRVALGVLGFVLFGSCLGHLGYLANDRNYRPVLILIFLSVELNDVFAFTVGKTLGERKLAPNTSPKKTIAGAVGALVLTTLMVTGIGISVFQGTVLASPFHLLTLGILVSVLGQCGDLMLSSIKRDLGIKDMAATIPGHGGLLDRFDSVILVAPAVFHYVNYFVGVGADQAPHVLTGG